MAHVVETNSRTATRDGTGRVPGRAKHDALRFRMGDRVGEGSFAGAWARRVARGGIPGLVLAFRA